MGPTLVDQRSPTPAVIPYSLTLTLTLTHTHTLTHTLTLVALPELPLAALCRDNL